MILKFCNHCKLIKRFYDGVNGRCQDCHKKAQRERYKRDPEPAKARFKRNYYKQSPK